MTGHADVEIRIVDPNGEDARFCLTSYYAEIDERFETGFDPGSSLDPHAAVFSTPKGAFLIAYRDGAPVGCAGIKWEADASGMVKRMWVSPDARGLGLGRRLLADLERLARDRGIEILRLETNRALSEAIGLYRSAGFVEVEPFNDEPYAHHWFEKRL
ncbi:MAG TPA: GNAT family N-acetyltransferase [Acidimicrobiia bacterium]